LGPIFEARISDRWPEHLEKMYRFWQTILLEEHTYTGAPFPPHASMGLTDFHFESWVGLFTTTVNELFEGVVANEAVSRAKLMATIFNSKINHLNSKA
jgi:hemoglobin